MNDHSKGILSLPNELIFQIIQDFSFSDLRKLARVSKYLAPPVEKELYTREVMTGDLALGWALRRGYFGAAGKAMTYGADVHKLDQDFSMLELATMHSSGGDFGIVKRLLEAGLSPNSSELNHEKPLMLASRKRRKDLMKLLMEYGADPNLPGHLGMRPLHILAANFHPNAKLRIFELHQLLIDHGADPNTQDHSGCTPLHLAVRNKSMDYINLLLKHGADCGIQNHHGETSFMTSLAPSEPWVIRRHLLQHDKSLVNIANAKGHTPLHWAAARGLMPEMDFLLKRGAIVNSTTKFNETPLHLALKMAKFDAVGFLVKARADANIKNKNGENAFYLCMKQLIITHKVEYGKALQYMLQNDPTDPEARRVFAKLPLWKYDTPEAIRCLERKGVHGERIVEILPDTGFQS